MNKTVFAIAASLLLYALLPSSTVEAHGDEIVRERAGPYEVVVAILPERPAIGTVHFSITPLDASDGQLVTQAKIWLTAHDEKGDPVYAARAVNLPATPRYYDTNVKFEEAGTWTIELTLEQESPWRSVPVISVGDRAGCDRRRRRGRVRLHGRLRRAHRRSRLPLDERPESRPSKNREEWPRYSLTK